ncbi:hypothetical protein DMA11_10460 [Marinilabiliaceae bacterium JC017]|nr:hypothetical protein DMA11_10460 [Marinilabiliaceae bacterium JC017]
MITIPITQGIANTVSTLEDKNISMELLKRIESDGCTLFIEDTTFQEIQRLRKFLFNIESSFYNSQVDR